jgi:hypothetical protein
MLWNHAYGRRTEPRDIANFQLWGDARGDLEGAGPKIAARREQVLAELRAEEELRANRSETS